MISFRYDLIRNGVTVGSLPVLSASIEHSAHATIKRTARFEMAEDSRINWLTDMIRPVLRIRGEDIISSPAVKIKTWDDVAGEFPTWDAFAMHTWDELGNGIYIPPKIVQQWDEKPLGVFIPSSQTRTKDTAAIYSVETYDQTVILQEDCIVERLFITAGTNYIAAIMQIMDDAGIVSVFATPTPSTLLTAREFEPGTTKLEIINTLLGEINYNTVTVNSDGVFILSPYVAPGADTVTKTYNADETSIIGEYVETDLDLYSVPNVFIAVLSNPECDVLTSVYENTNPSSPTSTVRRGRKIASEIYRPDYISDQSTLDAYVRRKAFEASQACQEITFETAIVQHENGEILELYHPEMHGVYYETGWKMDLRPGAMMQHTVRKVVIV